MTLLRIHVPDSPGAIFTESASDNSLATPAQQCQWALIDGTRETVAGSGKLTDLPYGIERVQLVLSAAQVLIVRASVPASARRRAGSLLAFAVEERIVGEPDANQVSWLGSSGDEDVLSITDKQELERWQQALADVGIPIDEVHCETLLLPVRNGEWSIAWNGSEGFVRSGEFEGGATDCGDRESPPLLLRLMLKEAAARGATPASIALYMTEQNEPPNIAAWQRELGVNLHIAGIWDWRTAPSDAGISLVQQRRRWQFVSGTAKRLKPAAWILGAALALHAVALLANWALLANEQRALRLQMESRFRTAFPDAVAVADPALQMRRKLAEARHDAGVSDDGDFLPMIEHLSAAAGELPVGTLQIVSYESGRMTLEFAAGQETAAQRIAARLIESGLIVDTSPASSPAAAITLTVRTS